MAANETRGIARAASATFVAQGVSFLATLLVGVAISRALGPDGKGQLSMMQQLAWLTATLLGLGLTSAHAYFVGSDRRTGAQVFSDSLALVVVLAVPAAVVMFALMSRAVPSLQGASPISVGLASLLIPLNVLNAHVAGIEVGLGRVPRVAMAQVAIGSVTLAATAVLFLSSRANVTSILVVQCVSLVLGMSLMALDVRRIAGRLLCRPSLTRLKDQASFALRAHIADIANILSLRQDVVLLGLLSSAANVGLYSVGVSFVEIVWYLPNSVTQALFARSVKAATEEGNLTAAMVLRITFVLMAVAVCVLAIVIRPLIVLLFGSKFASSAAVFYVLIPGILFMGLGRIALHHLAANGHLMPGPAFLAALINLVGNIFAIPRWGYLGAAAVSSASYSFYGIVMMSAFSRSSGIPLMRMVAPQVSDFVILVRRIRGLIGRAAK